MVNEPEEAKPKSTSTGEAISGSDEAHSQVQPSSGDSIPRKPGAASGPEPAPGTGTPSPESDLFAPSPESPATDLLSPGGEAEPESQTSPTPVPRTPSSPSSAGASTEAAPEDSCFADPSYSPDQTYHDARSGEGADERSHEEGNGTTDASGAEYAAEDGAESEQEEADEDEEDGGGPVKSFLEHLEDLRWTIIRCLGALVVGMVVCLVAGNKIVELLKEPLQNAQRLTKRDDEAFALIQFGTNKWVIDLATNTFGPFQSNAVGGVKLVVSPTLVGTNILLALVPAPLDRKEIPPANQIDLKNLGPVSPFVVAMKVALFGGIGLASPFILLFIGWFVVPALKRKEKKYLYRAVAIGSVLFCAGVLFCYFFMLQIALNAAVQFSNWMGFGADIWRAEDYIGFVVKFMLGMGLSFELPVVLLTLVKLELLDYQRMNKFRPYWVVVNLVIAAILTPPDVVSQMLMAIPLQLLFELSVLIAWYWHRRDQKKLAALESA